MSLQVLTTTLVDILGKAARTAAPREAVGLLVGDIAPRLIGLPNRSLSPTTGFIISGGDIKLALENARIDIRTLDWSTVTLWHSHPSGGVGPSRIDMQNKLPDINHLVVTLDGDNTIPGWY
jgi:proteasome lid subunit RPN8/RPN11